MNKSNAKTILIIASVIAVFFILGSISGFMLALDTSDIHSIPQLLHTVLAGLINP
jgi:hypothetical protein